MSNWDTPKEERAKRLRWIDRNQARMTELSEIVISSMDEKTLKELATEIVEKGWADYPEGFDFEWGHYEKVGEQIRYDGDGSLINGPPLF